MPQPLPFCLSSVSPTVCEPVCVPWLRSRRLSCEGRRARATAHSSIHNTRPAHQHPSLPPFLPPSLLPSSRTHTHRRTEMGAAGSHHTHTLSSSYTNQQQQWRDERKDRQKERGGRNGGRDGGQGDGGSATEIGGLVNEGGEGVERMISPSLTIPGTSSEGSGGGGSEGGGTEGGGGGGAEGGEGGGGGGGGGRGKVRFIVTDAEGLSGSSAQGDQDETFTPSYAAYTPSSRKTHGLR